MKFVYNWLFLEIILCYTFHYELPDNPHSRMIVITNNETIANRINTIFFDLYEQN